jgi:hypothetical protein
MLMVSISKVFGKISGRREGNDPLAGGVYTGFHSFGAGVTPVQGSRV